MEEQSEKDLYESMEQEVFYGAEPPVQSAVKETVEPLETLEADPWEGVSPALRSAIEGLNSRMGDFDRLNERIKQTEKRVGSVDNRLHELKAAPKAIPPEEIAKNKASEEGLNDFLNDFPTHGDSIKYLVKKTFEEGGLGKEVERVRAELQTDFDEKLSKAQMGFELKLLRSKYPSHKQITEMPEFGAWLQGQDLAMKEKASSYDALDAISVLDRFMESTKKKEQPTRNISDERQDRLASAAADNRKGTRPVKQKSEADMTEDELRAHIAKEVWSE